MVLMIAIENFDASHLRVIKKEKMIAFAEERRAIIGRLGVGSRQIFGAHGFKKDYSVNA